MSYTSRHGWLAVAMTALFALTVLFAFPPPVGAASAPGPTELGCVPDVTCPRPSLPCPNGDIQPAPGNLADIRHSTLCLLNIQRAKRKLIRFRENGQLGAVAARYARRMVDLSFFAHVTPGGSDVRRAGSSAAYLAHANGYELGENLAWGEGFAATPRQIVRSWMHSPEHRAQHPRRPLPRDRLRRRAGTPVAGGGPGRDLRQRVRPPRLTAKRRC